MKTFIVIGAAVAAVSASAQLVVTGPSTYYQDFNSLALAGTGWAWNDNLPTTSMPGWYSNQTTYSADDGSIAASGQYSYGPNNLSERALGSTALPGALIVYGLRMNNASGGSFMSLFVDYTGEQWRSGSTLTDKLIFEYSSNATALFTGTWTAFTPLDFNSPNNTGAGVLNGNLPANQANPVATITGLSWANGTDMWIRWTHVGGASRHALALDDLHVQATPVPEPMTLSVLGLAGLGLLRRRRKV
jgi:hypothetical protein